LHDWHTQEVELLTWEIDDANLRERELRSKVENIDWVMFDWEEENWILKKDLASTRSDMENMLRIMENNEGELSLHWKKEKMIDMLAADSRRKIEETMLEKDWLIVKEQ